MNARVLAAGAALALLLPAVARSDGDYESGVSCSLHATAENPQVEPRPTVKYRGTVTNGPWVTTYVGGVVVEVACAVQYGSDDPQWPDQARASHAGPYLPPTEIEFSAPSWEPVFLCTEIVVHRPPRPPDPPRLYDADPEKPGSQCQRAEQRDGSLLVVEAGPDRVDPYGCVRMDEQALPSGYFEACNILDP